MKKRILIAGIGLALILTGCGSKSGADSSARDYDYEPAAEESYYDGGNDFSSGYSDDYDYAAEEMADVEVEEYNDTTSSGASDDVSEEQVEEYGSKIIRNASISLDVGSLETFAANLKKTVYDYGGYIESMDINAYDSDYSESRYGYFTARIPAAKLDDFLNIVKDEGVVTAKSESAEDVTLQYVDVEARIETYEAERDSLMALLDEATNLKDILTIRDKIAEVNYELDSLQRQLKSMQNKVSYSTVTINAKETRSIAGNKGEKSYWSKIGENFMYELEDGLEITIDLLIFLITRLPLFLIIVLVIFIIVKIIKAIFGKSGKEKKTVKEKKTARTAKAKQGTAAPVQQQTPGVQPPVSTPVSNPAAAESVPSDKDGAAEPVQDVKAPVSQGGHYTSNVPPVPQADESVKKEEQQ